MTLTFRLNTHTVRPDVQVIELWFDGQFIGQITPGDEGPSLRVFSKHGFLTSQQGGLVPSVQLTVLVP